MTTVFKEKIVCTVCRNESQYNCIGSTNAFGPIDLDMRSPEMERSTIPYWVQRCPHCGYCSHKISDEITDAKFHIKSAEYREQLTNDAFPDLANSFLCRGLLYEWAKEYVASGWDCLRASWVCDDHEMLNSAVYCRKRALAMFEEALDSDQSFMENLSSQYFLMADISRRAGLHNKAIELLNICQGKINDPLLTRLYDYEKELIDKKDVQCHDMGFLDEYEEEN